MDAAALAAVRDALGDAPRRRDLLIEHLHRLQDAFGQLTAAHLVALAHEMRLPAAEVYEVATFYHHFEVVEDNAPDPTAHTVRICDSITCHLAGSDALLNALRARVGPDVRVVAAPCIGRCAHAPAAVVDRVPGGDRFAHLVDGATVAAIEAAIQSPSREPMLPDAIGYAAYRAAGGYRTLAACVRGERPAEGVIAAVERAGLRGLGGAGFPSARKWRYVRAEPGPRVMVLNADEGEPGTFKDRYCIETDPHRVLEGLLIAAWLIDADDVYVYLRDEYAACRAILTRELAALEADPPCALPRLHLRRGAGAYICGEETALLESLEGRRGEPRLRPPFPAQVGLFGRPTLVHNVETVYWLRAILEDEAVPGLRLFSVSGRVARPGVYAAPAGVTARELVEDYAGGMLPGHEFYAYLPGGASGGILPASLADLPLDFDSLASYGCFVGSGAVVILSDHDRACDAAHNLMRFFAHESCGKCTPCRSGTAKAVELTAGREWDRALLTDLSRAMADASICGLGQAAPNPVRCVMEHFPQELEP